MVLLLRSDAGSSPWTWDWWTVSDAPAQLIVLVGEADCSRT